MPQAPDELRDRMGQYFGDRISEAGPIAFLEQQGYTLRPDWIWRKPNPSHKVTEKELECMAFLVTEWDFGGLE